MEFQGTFGMDWNWKSIYPSVVNISMQLVLLES